ncbi:protein IWS1 homolog A-like [Euwallacea similis]|uniref:protein IWS1 homolog A-like n=1 Tax=Euwallacea similis TaxID=1736056 RepID=UPI00344C23D8
MILHGRSKVLEVFLWVLAALAASSARSANYGPETGLDGYEHRNPPDYSQFFKKENDAGTAASGKVATLHKPYTAYDAAFQEYLKIPAIPASYYEEPNEQQASSDTEALAPAPKRKQRIDPYEEIKQSVAAALHYNSASAASENKPQKAVSGEAVPPGPHYVSHKLPYYQYSDEDEAQSKDQGKTAAPPTKSKNKSKKKKVKASASTYQPYGIPYGHEPYVPEGQAEQTKMEPVTFYGSKNVDYNTGKSSSTVAQRPSASAYQETVKLPSTTANPYLQYQFPPAVNYEALQSKYLQSIATTPAPVKNIESGNLNEQPQAEIVPASSDNAPESTKNKNCRKIDGPENAENMNCFVCEDAVNKAKYTQCSYASSEEPVNQYAGSSIRYALPVQAPENFRIKRSPKKGRYSEDPYFDVAERNRKYFDELEKEQEAEESERQKEFHYTPFDADEYESYSENESAELLKQPGACKKVERDGSTCTVCKDPKTGGNFEQCSYTSAPKEKKYAYVAEKKFDSEDDAPEETKVVTKESSDPEEEQKAAPSIPVIQTVAAPDSFTSATKSKIVNDPFPELTAAGTTIDASSEDKDEGDTDDDTEDDDESGESETKKKEKQVADDYYYPSYGYGYGDLKKNKKLVDDDPYDVPEHFAASISKEKTADDESADDGFDEYHYKLFPELSNEADESRNDEQTSAGGQKQDVEEVLAEFAKKDRTNCKKAQKNGMTCFLCVDHNNVQHEECMYIAESKPKPTHIAYHEVQRLKDPQGRLPIVAAGDHHEETRQVEVKQPADALTLPSENSKRKKFFKKAGNSLSSAAPNAELTAAASDVVYKTVVPYEREKTSYVKETIKDSKAEGSAPDSERLEDESTKENNKEVQEPESPKEIEVGDEEGAYSHETEPVYSKLYGTVLPKYMVEKTDYEKDFDAASGFA